MSDQLPQPPALRDRIARLNAMGPVALASWQMVDASVRRAISAVDAEKLTPAQERRTAAQPGAVAVIPVRGVIVPREDRYSQMFGEVGAEDTANRVRQAVADSRVKAVVLDIDSPGGNVLGVTEANAAIRELRGKKPIIAHADWVMCSAAYWIGCAADEVVASPSALVGACGVITMAVDETKFLDDLGIKVTPYAKPDDKADGWGMWPNTDKFDARMKRDVADCYGQFVADIVASRPNTDPKLIQDEWAFHYQARRAKLLGMVDKVRTMSQTFAVYTANTGNQAAQNRLALLKRKSVQ